MKYHKQQMINEENKNKKLISLVRTNSFSFQLYLSFFSFIEHNIVNAD